MLGKPSGHDASLTPRDGEKRFGSRSIPDYHAKESLTTSSENPWAKVVHQKCQVSQEQVCLGVPTKLSHWPEASMGSMTSVQSGNRFQNTATGALFNYIFHNGKPTRVFAQLPQPTREKLDWSGAMSTRKSLTLWTRVCFHCKYQDDKPELKLLRDLFLVSLRREGVRD